MIIKVDVDLTLSILAFKLFRLFALESNRDGGYLVTEKNYDDFILEVDVKIDTSLNSGIQCRGQIWGKDTVTTVLNRCFLSLVSGDDGQVYVHPGQGCQ